MWQLLVTVNIIMKCFLFCLDPPAIEIYIIKQQESEICPVKPKLQNYD